MSKDPYETVDFIPTENSLEVAQRVRDWIQANASALLKDCHGTRNLGAYEGGHLHLELGGYVPNPEAEGRQANVEASLGVASGCAERLDPVTDPEGTHWHRSTFHADVNWPSYGSQGSQLARLRADMIVAAVALAERFDAEFRDTVVWSKGMTRAERDEWALKHRKDATRIKAAAHVKDAIHTTCRRMRVGDERFIPAPAGDLVEGTYEVAVEGKEYRVEVRAEEYDKYNTRFEFRRTK